MPDYTEPPKRVMIPLLDLIQQQALDEDYLVAAERRASTKTPEATTPTRGSSRKVAAAVVAVFGIMASTAAVQTRQNASVNDEGRSTLIARVNDQRARVSRLQESIAEVRSANTTREAILAQITETEQSLAPRLRRLRVRTGFIAVSGEGVRVTVNDEPTGSTDGVVQDEDLALLVDGLWSAGAEAIAINGQRLTALSAIRTSGVPIEVNGVGIAPPYTVLAIGDTDRLQGNFFSTSSGLAFNDLSDRYRFEFDIQNVDEMSLPSGPPVFLRLRSAVEGRAADQNLPNTEEMEK